MYDVYTVTLFSPNSLSHQEIDFSNLHDASECLEKLRFFFKKENIGVTAKLYHHEFEEESINPINSRELYYEEEKDDEN